MDLKGVNIGYCICGSFCTLKNSLKQMENLVKLGGKITPVMSYSVLNTDTRFGSSDFFIDSIEKICAKFNRYYACRSMHGKYFSET